MTSTPPNASDVQGKRTYIQPITQEAFTSVTTVLGILERPALPPWYGKLASAYTMENRNLIVEYAERPVCEDGKCRYCLVCMMKHAGHEGDRQRDKAGMLGTRVHDVAEYYALNGVTGDYGQDIAGRVAAFLDFVEQHRVTFQHTELTVLNRTYGYAGTLDAVLTCGWMPLKQKKMGLIGVPMITDYKTSRYLDRRMAMQLAAYAHAETIMIRDGREYEMPKFHDDYGLSLHIEADAYGLRTADIGPEMFQRFLNVLQVYKDQASQAGWIGRIMSKRIR